MFIFMLNSSSATTSTNSGVQATLEIKDFGVQVNLPLLTAEDLKGDDLKTKFNTDSSILGLSW